MKKFLQIIGLVGLVALGIGLLALLIGQKGNAFIYLHLIIGVLFCLLGLLSNFEGLREYFQKRAGKVYGMGVIKVLILVVIIFLIGYIGYQNDRVIDVTKNRIYELSETTRKILKELPGEIEVSAFLPSEGYDEARQLLKLYQAESKNFKLRIIDPDRHPELAEAKSISSYGTIVFEFEGQKTRTTDASEDRITNSLLRVSRKESYEIYFISGHGEADPEDGSKGGLSMMKQVLEDQNFKVNKLEITSKGIPESARLIVIAGPRLPYQNWEIQAIDHYLGKGGDAIFLLDPFIYTNLERMLSGYGAEVMPGMVIDTVHYLVGMDAVGLTPVVNNFQLYHQITMELKGKLVAFPRTQALKLLGSKERSGSWTPLVYSSDTSFLETDLDGLIRYGRTHQDPQDPKGPLVLASAYKEILNPLPWEEKQKQAKEIRMVLVGNSFFMRNMAFEVYSNYLLATNIFNWATGEYEMARISPKTRKPSRIFITAGQTQLIFYSAVLVIPELLCVLGLAIWWRRR